MTQVSNCLHCGEPVYEDSLECDNCGSFLPTASVGCPHCNSKEVKILGFRDVSDEHPFVQGFFQAIGGYYQKTVADCVCRNCNYAWAIKVED